MSAISRKTLDEKGQKAADAGEDDEQYMSDHTNQTAAAFVSAVNLLDIPSNMETYIAGMNVPDNSMFAGEYSPTGSDWNLRKSPNTTQGRGRFARKFEDIKQLPQKIKPAGARSWVCSYVCGLGKRMGIMTVFLAVLTVFLVPFHESVEVPKYRFDNMSFPWKTNPRDHLVPLDPAYNDYNVLLDGHSHTTLSDGKLTPEQLVEYAIAQGFNALVVTDHNTVAGGLRAERYAKSKHAGRLIVIPGMEYSTCRIHMNLININATVTAGNKAFPTDSEIRQVISRTHELGGLAIVNHIPWSNHTLERLGTPRLPNHPSLQSLVDWGVDGFEVVNQATFDMPTYQYMLAQSAARRLAADSPAAARLILMSGSDVHAPGPAFAWTVLKAPTFTKEAIVKEIKNARTSLLFDPTGNKAEDAPSYSSRYLALAPLSELAEYFATFYDRYQGQYSFHGTHCQSDVVDVHSVSVGFFIIYLLCGVVLFELVLKLFTFIGTLVRRWRTNNQVSA
ncbi:hypothetical protein GGI12_003128 [Dipsacomyces acuminosporus]|nr:hypothetical protein GGI12_003128 [Dipsacomyces acuminosporus]